MTPEGEQCELRAKERDGYAQVDAYKRIKECCDKSRDWASSADLRRPKTIAVIGGFFAEQNLEALHRAGVGFVWEHDLGGLGDYLVKP